MSTPEATVLSLTQTMLGARSGTALTREDIERNLDLVLAMKPDWAGEVDRDRLIRELETRFHTWIGTWRSIQNDEDHVGWLPERRAAIQWSYWNRYSQLLEERMAPQSVQRLDELSDNILGRLEEPNRLGPWDRRGLVVGHVQSGKTANYIGLICKAADAGYKLIVVLAGMHKNLRSQTQIRLDEGFLGYDSTSVGTAPRSSVPAFGVGRIDPSVRADTITNRTDNGDFKKSVAEHFSIHPGGTPLLFVIKKNASVLRNLLEWVEWAADSTEAGSGRRFIADVPLLVIDDEADHGSVDTKAGSVDEDGNPDLEHDPTVINRRIRGLLRSFEKSAYVGYTATPFANIFIYDEGHTDKHGDDLFPRSFIVSLPAPSNYMGPSRLFGLSSNPEIGIEYLSGLPLIRHIDDYTDSQRPDEATGWMPSRHRKTHRPRWEGRDEVPPSLRKAMLSFVLTCAARRARGQLGQHNSMLIHVTRFTAVQAEIAEQVRAALVDIRRRLRYGDGDAPTQLRDELKQLWQTDYCQTTRAMGDPEYPTMPWSDVDCHLVASVEAIEVREINGSAGDILDYEAYRDAGFSVIAVGGDKLARGLTLEGLSVSYFLRASRMYDTLMQMGRWFGYRAGYADLCRLYLTPELEQWFRHISEASEELRLEFDHMSAVGGTPRDYGLRVLSHPVLMVTSQVKMRSGKELELTFSGRISETVVFHRDQETILGNFNALEATIARLGPASPRCSSTRAGRARGVSSDIWTNVSPDVICAFLRTVKTHRDARKVNCLLLAEFIEKQVAVGELVEWTVALISTESGQIATIAGHEVGLATRGLRGDYDDRFAIGRLLSPTDEAIDLDTEAYAEALRLSVQAAAQDSARGQDRKPPTIPGGVGIRSVRPCTRGLLLLYPLSLTDSAGGVVALPAPIVGFGLSFPGSESKTRVKYIVDNVYWSQEYGVEA